MAATKAALAFAYALLCVIVAVASPAFADDADLKKQVDQIDTAYVESFNKQDVAGVVALYATGGIIVSPMGMQTDVAQFYNGAFKAGFNRLELTTDQVSTLGPDTAIAMGKYKVTGKNQSGAPIEGGGFWTAAYVREGGKLKIRMLTGVPQPPPAK